MPIVWVFPNRRIEITYLSERWKEHQRREGEETAALVDRLSVLVRRNAPHLSGATPHLVPSSDIPVDRSKRDDWTLDRTTRKVREMTQQEKDDRDGKATPR